MDFKKLFTNILLLSLFVFGLMSFILITQTNNGVTDNITNNSIINRSYYDLYGNLSESQAQAQSSSDTFGSITPSQTYGELEVTSVVSPTRVFKTMGIGSYNILIRLPMQILGVSPIVASVISAIVILLFVIGIWAIWKGVVN